MQVTYIQLYMNDEAEGMPTSLTPAKTKSVSLRTTVPMSIVKQFGLTAKDKLIWKLKVENGELVILIKPSKGE